MAIAVTTGVLFALALILGIWVIVKSRRSTLLSSSREELSTDRKLLEERQS